jgi:hypothetical protein
MGLANATRQMTRLLPSALGLVLALAAPATAHARSAFDADAGLVRLPKDALRTIDFETADSLVGLELGAWDNSGNFPVLKRTPIAQASDIAARLTTDAADFVEGAHGLRLGDAGTGLVIRDAALFDRVKDGQFEVTLWGRADGTSPQLYILYDQDPENVFGSTGGEFAMVRAIRTGRQTSDGWAEISSGPLDGSIWGVPVRGIAVVPSSGAAATDAFVVDALDITQGSGRPVPATACTQANVEAVCGAQGDCMFGHCVSSTVTWGVLPPAGHRSEIVERWIMLGTRFIGDRAGTQNGLHILEPDGRALAANATSSRQFFGGLNRLVNLLRDNHTSFGSPNNFTEFMPQVDYGASSTLGACFGVVDKDLLGGGLGFAVYRAVAQPLTGVPLQRGDLLYAIDGRDPKEWLDDVWPRYATTMPNDASSDWGAVAGSLSRLITTRASTVTLLRCASPTACEGGNRQEITVDVAGAVFEALVHPETAPTTSKQIGCSQRFLETAGGGGGFMGEDSVRTATSPTGETLVEFDGFIGTNFWQAAFRQIFAASPPRVIMDARMGHGGYYQAVVDLFNMLRGTNEPFGVMSVGRGTYDLTDPPWLFDRLGQCLTQLQDQWACLEGNATGVFTSQAAPAGGASKIAWLNTNDVSANDFMPRLLEGRSNLRIFAPHPTAGAFGSIADLPSIATNWGGGSLQVEDSRFADNRSDLTTARWESSHGVVPDVVVAEKLSDAIAGVDTIVQAATAWLEAP